MSTTFAKNCVLMGDLNSYCLVCSTALRDEQVLAHIQASTHKAAMKDVTYFGKFKNDFIKKVKLLFFCEICNRTFSKATAVAQHIKEETHLEGKRRQFKLVGDSIVFQDDILIAETVWNGFIGDTCVICNEEFQEDILHKNEDTHKINMINNRVIVDEQNNIYRKVKDGHHCLTCNIIVSESVIREHFASEDHLACVDQDPNDYEQPEVKTDYNIVNAGASSSKDAIIVPNLRYHYVSALDMSLYKRQFVPKITKLAEDLAEHHDLIINKKDCTIYCELCKLLIPGIYESIKDHVESKKHRDRMYKSVLITNRKIRHRNFCENILHDTVAGSSYVVINDSFCLPVHSYVGYITSGATDCCQFCRMTVRSEAGEAHLKSALHYENMGNSLVVSTWHNEFIRQIATDFFQCGMCGVLVSFFDNMVAHLDTDSHQTCKAHNEKILDIIRYKRTSISARG